MTQTAAERDAEASQRYAAAARAAITRKDPGDLARAVDGALFQMGGTAALQPLFRANPDGLQTLMMGLADRIDDVGNSAAAETAQGYLTRLRSSKILSTEDMARLDKRFTDVLLAGARSGKIQLNLSSLNDFPVLQEMKPALARQSIRDLPSSQRARVLRDLVAYVKEVGPETDEGKKLQSEMFSAGMRRSELTEVAALPLLTSLMKAKLFAPTRFQLVGGDRLLADDIRQVLAKRFSGANWVDAPAEGVISITIEKVRHDERQLPPRRETVTYAQHQVNLASAVLLMPRNASYMYDVDVSEAEIEYGFVLRVEGGGQPFEEVVRGNARGRNVQCSNARIQNVFGGTTSASFIANDHMASTCGNGSGKSQSSLRSEVLEKLADTAAKAPQLSALAAE